MASRRILRFRSKPRAAVLVAVLLVCGGCEQNGLELPAGPVPDSRIESRILRLVDTARATPSNGTFPGADSRTLVTHVWFAVEPPKGAPACDPRGRCHLVVLAHGLGGRPESLSVLARALARAGYIVAAPTFPLTVATAPGGALAGEGDLSAQPGDLSFVIDSLDAASAREGDVLHGRVADPPVGLVGHSFGGSTAIAASRLECCRDARIDAVVLVAPAVQEVGHFQEGIAGRGPPTLLIHGEDDHVVDISESRRLYAAIAPPRYLVELDGAGHAELLENPASRISYAGASIQAIVAFFDATLGDDPQALQPTLDEIRDLGHTVQSHRG